MSSSSHRQSLARRVRNKSVATSMCQSMVAAPRNHILDYSRCFTLGIQPAGGTGMPHWQTTQETISSPVEICIAFSLPAVPWERSFLFRLSTSSPKTSCVVCGRGSKGWSYSVGPWVSHAARAGGCWQGWTGLWWDRDVAPSPQCPHSSLCPLE